MNACLKLGGDPNFHWYGFGIYNFEVPDDFFEELRRAFPKLKPLEIKTPLLYLPPIECCACGKDSLPIRSSIAETLALTHVFSSLVLGDGKIFLFDEDCAKEIRDHMEINYHCAVQHYPTPHCRHMK